MERIKVARLTIEVLNQYTGEIIKLSSTPEELMTVMETLNKLNPDDQFCIRRIYSYGDVQTLEVTTSPRMEWKTREE